MDVRHLNPGHHSNPWFTRLANRVAHEAGRPRTSVLAAGIVVAWGLSGPLFGHSDTWQLVINTSTTIVTFLMVFIIQNTQTRDTQAMQVKLDELIRATPRKVLRTRCSTWRNWTRTT